MTATTTPSLLDELLSGLLDDTGDTGPPVAGGDIDVSRGVIHPSGGTTHAYVGRQARGHN